MQPAMGDQYPVRVATLHEIEKFSTSLAARKTVETPIKELVRWARERAAIAPEVRTFIGGDSVPTAHILS